MISVEDVTLQVADALARCAIPYMLVGAFSSNQYGIPRSTKDADFVVQVTGAVGAGLTAALGPQFELEPQVSFETNTGTSRQMLACRGSPFKVELFFLSNDPHDQERFKRRRCVGLLNREFWFPTAEDVVITKLRWARNKDIEDVRNILTVQRGKLDWPYIESWCRQHGTLALLGKIRSNIPDI